MLTQIFLAFLSMFTFGYGLSLLLHQKSRKKLTLYLQAPLVGIIFLIVISSILGAAKINLNTLMFAKKNLLGYQFLLILSLIPTIYSLVLIFAHKIKTNIFVFLLLFLSIIFTLFLFINPKNASHPQSPNIIELAKMNIKNLDNSFQLSTTYLNSFFSFLPGLSEPKILSIITFLATSLFYLSIFSKQFSSNKNFLIFVPLLLIFIPRNILDLPEKMLLSGFLSLVFYLTNICPDEEIALNFSFNELLLAGTILAIILTFPFLAYYLLATMFLWLIILSMTGNKNFSIKLLKGLILSFFINPLFWGIVL